MLLWLNSRPRGYNYFGSIPLCPRKNVLLVFSDIIILCEVEMEQLRALACCCTNSSHFFGNQCLELEDWTEMFGPVESLRGLS